MQMTDPILHVENGDSAILSELAEGRSVMYFTCGVSMRPLLRTAETHVHILPIKEAESYLERGIVLYRRANGQLVLHRLIRRDGDIYYMRGDNTYGLEPIRQEQLLGVVDLIWRKNRYIDVATDRRYHRYVKRRIWNYPLRCVVYYPYRFARSVAARIWKPNKRK